MLRATHVTLTFAKFGPLAAQILLSELASPEPYPLKTMNHEDEVFGVTKVET